MFANSVVAAPPRPTDTGLSVACNSQQTLQIAVVGPGQIGGFLAVLLSQPPSGISLQLYGRRALPFPSASARWFAADGRNCLSAPVPLQVETHWQALAQADLVLLAVKATALAAVCQQLKAILPANTPVVACQNGLGVPELIKAQLPNPVYQMIVPFNVVQDASGCYQQTSGGQLICPSVPAVAPLLQACSRLGVPVQLTGDIRAAVYGKLLLNLNNALNAISDLPLYQQLNQRPWRLLLALLMQEWLACCQAEGVQPLQLTKVPARWLPVLLKLPDWLFRRIAASMLRIDPAACLSMWHDLQKAHPTEIDFLNGAVVRRAAELGLAAPANQLVAAQIHVLSQRSPDGVVTRAPTAGALLTQLRTSHRR